MFAEAVKEEDEGEGSSGLRNELAHEERFASRHSER